MFKKFQNPIAATAVMALVLVFALSAAWAAYYSGSVTVKTKGRSVDKSFLLVDNGADRVEVTIRKDSLDAYMAEQGINSVNITADLNEEWVDTGGGSGYYRLTFVFGPSGAYFTPDELEVKLQGKYVSGNTAVAMYSEDGEALESTSSGNWASITFYVPHFSSYSYDHYDY